MKPKHIKVHGVVRKCPFCGEKLRISFAVLSDLKGVKHKPPTKHKPDFQI